VNYPSLELRVWGEYACFTEPLQKLERVSYEVMTPSAARGILEAIFSHPPYMQWRVREIAVLKPIKHFSILRNEVASRMSPRSDSLSITDDRSQKHTLGLRDVAYVIKADVHVPAGTVDREGKAVDPAKYRDQFRKRVERGQCFHRPYLGCREFACHFARPDGTEQPIKATTSLGRMLLDIEYDSVGDAKRVHFFDAELVDGRLAVPQGAYNDIWPKGGAK
jgi:CRISPR-associated protein Cas5d